MLEKIYTIRKISHIAYVLCVYNNTGHSVTLMYIFIQGKQAREQVYVRTYVLCVYNNTGHSVTLTYIVIQSKQAREEWPRTDCHFQLTEYTVGGQGKCGDSGQRRPVGYNDQRPSDSISYC